MNKETKRILLQVVLFVITFITTTFAGAEWAYGKNIFFGEYTWNDFASGFAFSIPLLLILTVHEFGHYFTAMYHKVKSSLPYYIPIPPIPFFPSLGTMGAVIRLRSRPYSNIQNFDIGLAGPLAGFIATIGVMIYGFSTLPPPEYIFEIHPEYKQYGLDYAKHVYQPEYFETHKPIGDIQIGKNLLFQIAEKFVDDPRRVPNAHEVMHFPVLFAAYFALLFTCLNLLPIGQLDGGHIAYGLFGYSIHKKIAIVFFLALMFYAGIGIEYINPRAPQDQQILAIPLYLFFMLIAFQGFGSGLKDRVMYILLFFSLQYAFMHFFPAVKGYYGWIVFGMLLGRFIGVAHPRSEIERPLNGTRIVLGWLALIIFILCFSPAPIRYEVFIDQP
jgi:membrane-associated protease RseP (regulator of RpoE activity)